MGTALFISYRESLEIVLLLIPLLAYLNKTGQGNLKIYTVYGMIGGLITSLITGTTIYFTLNAFSSDIQELIIGGVNLFLSMLILYSVFLISKPKSFTNIDGYKNSIRPSFLVTLMFITVFREILEITLFTLPTLIYSLLPSLLGVIIGLTLTVITGFILNKATDKVNINLIFIIITGILIYFGADLFGEALEIFIPQGGEILPIIGVILYIVPTGIIYIKRNMKLFKSLILKDKN